MLLRFFTIMLLVLMSILAWQGYAYLVWGPALVLATPNVVFISADVIRAWQRYEWDAINMPALGYVTALVVCIFVVPGKITATKATRRFWLMAILLACLGLCFSLWLWLEKISWLS
jgi:hypothetical protein